MSALISAQQLRDVLECPKGFGAVVVECPNDDFPFQAAALGQSGISLSALRVPSPRNSRRTIEYGLELSALRASMPGNCLRTIGDVLECPKVSHSTQRH